MKAVVFICFLFSFGFLAESQTSKEERPYYYLGKHDNKDLYIKSMFSQRSNQVTLYELTDTEIIESEKIVIQNAIIHQLYCYNEAFYAITSSVECDKFYMTTFDKFLKEKESIEILTLTNSQIRGLKSGDYSLKFYHKKDRAAILLIEHDIVACSINFSSQKSSTFTIQGGINFNYVSDVYLEDGLDLFLSRRDELFHFKNGVLSEPRLDQVLLHGKIDEWVFLENESEPYLFSMLNKGGLNGFAYCTLENANSGSFQLKECVLNRQKTNSKKDISANYNSFVKAEIVDNKIICTMQRIEQAINESILISCIDIDKRENLWNFAVLSIHDAPYIWKENENSSNRASFSFIKNDKLIFFFNAAVKKLDPENFFETDKRVITYDISIQTTIIKSEIDINTGENTTKPIHADYTSESFKIFNASYHINKKGELYFITYKEFTNKPYYEMLKPEKKVEVIQL
ncbi:hypothetical protein [Fluviicola taffensis]|uniref:Uncharacterized protein n=1 Tax=Fluviicola taffensis (strain DSM 16823 / NCIMB 13979 / RW262) TaxID=755732 RepID=F2I953_FLUTR|nr:hypothetical protein [Fluviicola taffensis]AEA43000.1 hypothetical protein Fluta_1001 [Fluviicola taffensis DSM 16823]